MKPELLYITKRMQGKMEGFRSLNTSPLDNSFCNYLSGNPRAICHYCYSRKSLKTYAQSGRKPWRRNGDILALKVLPEEDLPVINDDVFRFHAHGELLNNIHYINFINIAKKNPDCRFLLPTKRKVITTMVHRSIIPPENLVLSYSEPFVNNLRELIPFGFDRRFSVFTKDYAKEHEIDINCAGKKCMECLQCYRPGMKVQFINEHLK